VCHPAENQYTKDVKQFVNIDTAAPINEILRAVCYEAVILNEMAAWNRDF